MLANAVAVVINLTDQKFVSMLGEASIAAVGVSRPIIFLLSALFMGVSAAATAMVARAVGASDTDRADHVAGQALVLSVLVSAALAVAGYLAAPRLLAGMATPPSVYPLALGYLRVNFLGIVSMFTFHVFINIGMTIHIMPVTGVPLPFLSYGGSSMLLNMACVAMLINIDRHREDLRF